MIRYHDRMDQTGMYLQSSHRKPKRLNLGLEIHGPHWKTWPKRLKNAISPAHGSFSFGCGERLHFTPCGAGSGVGNRTERLPCGEFRTSRLPAKFHVLRSMDFCFLSFFIGYEKRDAVLVRDIVSTCWLLMKSSKLFQPL